MGPLIIEADINYYGYKQVPVSLMRYDIKLTFIFIRYVSCTPRRHFLKSFMFINLGFKEMTRELAGQKVSRALNFG